MNCVPAPNELSNSSNHDSIFLKCHGYFHSRLHIIPRYLYYIDIVSSFHILKVCAYNLETGSLLTQSPAGPYYIIKNHDDQWGMYKACVLDVEGRALDYYNVITKEMDTCSTYEGSNSGKQKY